MNWFWYIKNWENSSMYLNVQVFFNIGTKWNSRLKSHVATIGWSQVTAIPWTIPSVPPFIVTMHLAQLTHFTGLCGHMSLLPWTKNTVGFWSFSLGSFQLEYFIWSSHSDMASLVLNFKNCLVFEEVFPSFMDLWRWWDFLT